MQSRSIRNHAVLAVRAAYATNICSWFSFLQASHRNRLQRDVPCLDGTNENDASRWHGNVQFAFVPCLSPGNTANLFTAMVMVLSCFQHAYLVPKKNIGTCFPLHEMIESCTFLPTYLFFMLIACTLRAHAAR